MDASGSWDAIDWNQIEDPRPRMSSHGMDDFLLKGEQVQAQGHGVVLLNTDEAGIVSVTNFRLLFVSQATKSIIDLGTIPLTTIEKLNDDVKLQSLPRQYDKKQPRELLQVIGCWQDNPEAGGAGSSPQRCFVFDLSNQCANRRAGSVEDAGNAVLPDHPWREQGRGSKPIVQRLRGFLPRGEPPVDERFGVFRHSAGHSQPGEDSVPDLLREGARRRIVSGVWSQRGHLGWCWRPWRAKRSPVQHRS